MSVFLSCFRKNKKGDKKSKKGDKKTNAPIAALPPKEPSPSPKAKPKTDTQIPSIAVDDHSKDGDTKRLNGSKDFQETGDALGDFSAVRETEVLKSYRKAPPPQNRARQSKAPRALLKSSMENLDLFSGTNDELFRSSEDIETSTPNKSLDEEDGTDDKEDSGRHDDVIVNKMDSTRGSSQGRSSMLEEINSTLASIHSSEVRKSMENIAKEVKDKEKTSVAAAEAGPSTDIRKSMEDIAKAVQQKMNANIDKEEEKAKEVAEDVSQPKYDDLEVMEKVESVVVESVQKTEDEIEERLEDKAAEVEKEVVSGLHNGVGAVKDYAEQVRVEDIVCDLKGDETRDVAEAKVAESLELNNHQDDDNKDDNDDEEEVVITETFEVDLGNLQEKEVKIPPKVSPKPSPKIKQRNILENIVTSVPAQLSPDSCQQSEEETEEGGEGEGENQPPSPQSFGEKIVEKVEEIVVERSSDILNGDHEEIVDANNETANEEKDEKVESLPPTPTTPTSPTMKGQSRIPMSSKKSSGIPKLAFSSPKPTSSPSPVSSPVDSTTVTTRLDQAASDLSSSTKTTTITTTTNHTVNDETPSSPTSPQGDSELTRSTKESSPFNGDSRGSSKSKLTKLRYSGRKKSSESKSDESGSERGSRAGSEAKEEVPEVEKNSRIPVRGGSKPRSSPPKSLGN